MTEQYRKLFGFKVEDVRAISDDVLRDENVRAEVEREEWKAAYARVCDGQGILLIREKILEQARMGRRWVCIRDLRLPDAYIIQNTLEDLGFQTEVEEIKHQDYDDDDLTGEKPIRVRYRTGNLNVEWKDEPLGRQLPSTADGGSSSS